jgi:hypothetical protein
MATRSNTTFKKRQKELARMEKQREKAAKRVQRKAEKRTLDSIGIEAPEPDEAEESEAVSAETSAEA